MVCTASLWGKLITTDNATINCGCWLQKMSSFENEEMEHSHQTTFRKRFIFTLKKNQKCSTVLNVQKGWGRGSKGIICFQGQVIVPQSQDRTDHSEPAG